MSLDLDPSAGLGTGRRSTSTVSASPSRGAAGTCALTSGMGRSMTTVVWSARGTTPGTTRQPAGWSSGRSWIRKGAESRRRVYWPDQGLAAASRRGRRARRQGLRALVNLRSRAPRGSRVASVERRSCDPAETRHREAARKAGALLSLQQRPRPIAETALQSHTAGHATALVIGVRK